MCGLDQTNPAGTVFLQVVEPGEKLGGLAVVIGNDDFIMLIACALQDADQAALQVLEVVLAMDDDRHLRATGMTVVDTVTTRHFGADLGLITARRQMTNQRLTLVIIGCEIRCGSDQQRLGQMGKTGQATGFDQAQQQVELECRGEFAGKTTDLHQRFTANQPVPRNECRHALQQVEIEGWTEHIDQRAIGLAMNFVHRHRTATLGVLQLETGAQETGCGEFVTRLGQQQPVRSRLASDLVQLVDVIGRRDFDEMQGVLCSGDDRQVARGEDHHLERPECTLHEAIQSDLEFVHVCVQIEQQNAELRPPVVSRQVLVDPPHRGVVRLPGLQPVVQTSRRHRVEQLATVEGRHTVQTLNPVGQHLRIGRLVHLPQLLRQFLHHPAVEGSQLHRFKQTVLDRCRTVIGVGALQGLLLEQCAFHFFELQTPGRHRMQEKLALRELFKESAVVERHFDVLLRPEDALRFHRRILPVRLENRFDGQRLTGCQAFGQDGEALQGNLCSLLFIQATDAGRQRRQKTGKALALRH